MDLVHKGEKVFWLSRLSMFKKKLYQNTIDNLCPPPKKKYSTFEWGGGFQAIMDKVHL